MQFSYKNQINKLIIIKNKNFIIKKKCRNKSDDRKKLIKILKSKKNVIKINKFNKKKRKDT